MRAAIVSIGDELTLGQNLDTNSAWLAARLAEIAILTVEHRTVPDDRAAIAQAIRQLADQCDLLLTTGGLGPTADDLTREAFSDVLTPGQELIVDQAAFEQLENWFRKRNRAMPPLNTRQAQRPVTMRCVPNPHGTAPGLRGQIGQCHLFALPGPPREMQPMFLDHVAPAVQKDAQTSGDVLLTAAVHEAGLAEAEAAGRLGSLMDRDRNPLVGTTASDSIISARIRATGPRAIAQRQLDDTIAQIEALWRPYAFGRDQATLSEAVGAMLRRVRRTLVTAESCTGGWLGKSITDTPGSSAYYLGGWITYSNELKVQGLGVDEQLIEACGAVSAEAAGAMAQSALRAGGADYSLAITGIAGPDGATPQKPVGSAYISLARRTGAPAEPLTRRFQFPGDRPAVRDRSVKAAMQMLRFAILEAPDDTPLLWQHVRPAPQRLNHPKASTAQ